MARIGEGKQLLSGVKRNVKLLNDVCNRGFVVQVMLDCKFLLLADS